MNEILNPPGPPVEVERKCRIEEVFEGNFLELLRLVPRNPLVRALILKVTGQMPEPGCVTFEQLQEWVEMNCEKPAPPPPAQNRRSNREDGIAIHVDFSEVEIGRADYTVRRSGTDQFRLGAEEVMEIVEEAIEAGGGLEEAVELIAGKIDDNAWNECDPYLDDYGDYNYDEHEANDTSNSETSYSRGEIRNAVLAFVRERHPELAAEL